MLKRFDVRGALGAINRKMSYPIKIALFLVLLASGTALATSITLSDGEWVGLGASAGRLQVDDQTVDILSIEDADLLVNGGDLFFGSANSKIVFDAESVGQVGYEPDDNLVHLMFTNSQAPNVAVVKGDLVLWDKNMVWTGFQDEDDIAILIPNQRWCIAQGTISLGSPGLCFDVDAHSPAWLTVDNMDLVLDEDLLVQENASLQGSLVVNDSSYGNREFRVESDADTHLIYVNTANDRVGISDSTPDALLDVDGDTIINGTLDVTGATTGWLPFVVHQTLPPFSASTNNGWIATVVDDGYLTSFNISAYVVTTNDASNYWKLELIDGQSTVWATVTTSAQSADAWTVLSTTPSTTQVIATTDQWFKVKLTKVGSPGNLIPSSPAVRYRPDNN